MSDSFSDILSYVFCMGDTLSLKMLYSGFIAASLFLKHWEVSKVTAVFI